MRRRAPVTYGLIWLMTSIAVFSSEFAAMKIKTVLPFQCRSNLVENTNRPFPLIAYVSIQTTRLIPTASATPD